LAEKIDLSQELTGGVDIDIIVPPTLKEKLNNRSIESIDSCVKNGIYWAIVKSTELNKTKRGDYYLKFKLMGDTGLEHICFCWNLSDNDLMTLDIPAYSVIVLTITMKEFNDKINYETKLNKIRKVG
jgi:hypothetical protein